MKKRIIAILLLVLILCTVTAPAACADDYTYTVRIYAGENGKIDGQDYIEIPERFHYGDIISLESYISKAQANNEMYEVKGFKESGLDTRTIYSGSASYEVKKDVDFVVAYGVPGSLAEYKVYYVDQNGKELLAPETLKGSVGDRPIVACRHIDNYIPNAYNVTKTLTNNSADNVFIFTYKPITAETEYYYYYQQYQQGQNIAANADNAAVIQNNNGGYEITQPEVLKDLDEEQVPLDMNAPKMSNKMKAAYALAGVATLIGAGLIIFAIVENKEKKA